MKSFEELFRIRYTEKINEAASLVKYKSFDKLSDAWKCYEDMFRKAEKTERYDMCLLQGDNILCQISPDAEC